MQSATDLIMISDSVSVEDGSVSLVFQNSAGLANKNAGTTSKESCFVGMGGRLALR